MWVRVSVPRAALRPPAVGLHRLSQKMFLLAAALPKEAEVFDIRGNGVDCGGSGDVVAIPVTDSPVYLTASDVEALTRRLERAEARPYGDLEGPHR